MKHPLDRVYCPSCAIPMTVRGSNGGHCAVCPTCEYSMDDIGPAPTLRRIISGEAVGRWNDVDLSAWTQLVLRLAAQ